MLSLEHSAILLTCIMRYLVLKCFELRFEWQLKKGFTVMCSCMNICLQNNMTKYLCLDILVMYNVLFLYPPISSIFKVMIMLMI